MRSPDLAHVSVMGPKEKLFAVRADIIKTKALHKIVNAKIWDSTGSVRIKLSGYIGCQSERILSRLCLRGLHYATKARTIGAWYEFQIISISLEQ